MNNDKDIKVTYSAVFRIYSDFRESLMKKFTHHSNTFCKKLR